MRRICNSRKYILTTLGACIPRSHLISRLVEQGLDVICEYNRATGSKWNFKYFDRRMFDSKRGKRDEPSR